MSFRDDEGNRNRTTEVVFLFQFRYEYHYVFLFLSLSFFFLFRLFSSHSTCERFSVDQCDDLFNQSGCQIRRTNAKKSLVYSIFKLKGVHVHALLYTSHLSVKIYLGQNEGIGNFGIQSTSNSMGLFSDIN